jgi:hypothetical protein
MEEGGIFLNYFTILDNVAIPLVGTSGISKGGRCKFPEFLEFFTILESTASEISYLSELGPMEFNGWKIHFS